RDIAVPGLSLSHLLGAAMVEPDLGNRIDNLLAVKLDRDAQHSVRAGMLRTDVEKQEIFAIAFSAHAPFLRAEPERLLLGILLFLKEVVWLDVRRACRMVFAQRVALPALRHQDSLKVRVAIEPNAEHVPHFPLIPVGRGPNVSNRG